MKILCCQLLAVMLILAYHTVIGQSSKKTKILDAIVSGISKGERYKGPLREVSDSSVTILSDGKRVPILATRIKTIKFQTRGLRRPRSPYWRCLVFTLEWAGRAGGDQYWTADEIALVGGVVVSGVGSFLGVIIGSLSVKEKMLINGSIETFRASREKMKAYLSNANKSSELVTAYK